jgi:peptidoglycan/LPS O-acetylase OafA/YrhL
MRRLNELDGLRAIAIFWVALNHYCFFWAPVGDGPDLLPYGDLLSGVYLAKFGQMGVYLFFVVSGVVITMSLDTTRSFAIFALRRLARLWPSMFLCATATFAVTSYFGPAELMRSLSEYLLSMTFVFPGHIGIVLGYPDWQWLDGAYWSLWVEVRFYVVAGVIWFTLRDWRLEMWAAFAGISGLLFGLGAMGNGLSDALSRMLFAAYQPYFSFGIALAALAAGYKPRLARALLVGATLQAVIYESYEMVDISMGFRGVAEPMIGLCIVLILPSLAVLSPGRIKWAGALPLRTTGRASYGYYLLHQNLGMSLLLATRLAGWRAVVAMLGIQAVVLCTAFGLYHWVEKPMSDFVHRRTK